MKMQRLYSTIKPYVAMAVIALTMTSLNVNAIGHKNEENNPSAQHQKGEGHGKHHNKMKKHFHRLVKKLALKLSMQNTNRVFKRWLCKRLRLITKLCKY